MKGNIKASTIIRTSRVSPSGKEYKITVDDSGTISATEVR